MLLSRKRKELKKVLATGTLLLRWRHGDSCKVVLMKESLIFLINSRLRKHLIKHSPSTKKTNTFPHTLKLCLIIKSVTGILRVYISFLFLFLVLLLSLRTMCPGPQAKGIIYSSDFSRCHMPKFLPLSMDEERSVRPN